MKTSAITGDKELDRKLAMLADKAARRAVARGVNKSLGVVAKAMRSAINGADASTVLKREARRAIGRRFLKGGTDRMGRQSAPVAKAGVGVGKKTNARSKAIAAAQGQRAKRGASRGVGVSLSNIHWWFLGTAERTQNTTGRSVGRIAAVFGEVIARAFASSQSAALKAARIEIEKVIKQEAQRKP